MPEEASFGPEEVLFVIWAGAASTPRSTRIGNLSDQNASYLNGMLTLGFTIALLSPHVQGDLLDGDRTISSILYENADVVEVLRVLFRECNENYVIDPNVHGTINLSLKGAHFSKILKSILDQVNASSRIEEGVYFVKPEQPEETRFLNRPVPAFDFSGVELSVAIDKVFQAAGSPYRHERIKSIVLGKVLPTVTLQEDLNILLPLGDLQKQFVKGQISIQNKCPVIPDGTMEKRLTDLNFVSVDLGVAIRALLRQAGANYDSDSDIGGKLTFRLKEVPFGVALRAMCRSANLNYTVSGSDFHFIHRQ